MKQSFCTYRLAKHVGRVALISSGLVNCLAALANPLPPLAPSSSDGSYTVSARGCNLASSSATCVAQWVEERIEPSGSFQSSSGTYTNKPAGVYSYRSADYYCDVYFVACFGRYSEPVTVVVGTDIPTADPLDVQLTYRYSVKAGNVVGDAKPDLLIQRTAGGESGNGVIDSVILQQHSDQEFTAIVPTQSQLAASAWSNTGLTAAVEDINVDGFVDVIVKNVGSLAAGAKDQVVYSSGQPLIRQPRAVQALDNGVQQFSTNMLDYMVNQNYFAENAPLKTSYSLFSYRYCPQNPAWDIDGGMLSLLHCITQFQFYYAVLPDYSGFSNAAIEVWRQEQGVANGTLTSAAAAGNITKRISDLLDVSIGGWNMREIFSGTNSTIDDPADRKGLEAFLAVIGIARAQADETDSDTAPKQSPRNPDEIYIVGRYIFGSSVNKLHTALYYQLPIINMPTWVSAFDSNKSALFDGTLVAETNDMRDSPLLMRMTLGTVIPANNGARYAYYFGDIVPAHEHYRDLPNASKAPYDAIPEVPSCLSCPGRNSNGYISGLIAATKGQPSVDPGFNLNGLTGWEYPVEAHYFGR